MEINDSWRSLLPIAPAGAIRSNSFGPIAPNCSRGSNSEKFVWTNCPQLLPREQFGAIRLDQLLPIAPAGAIRRNWLGTIAPTRAIRCAVTDCCISGGSICNNSAHFGALRTIAAPSRVQSVTIQRNSARCDGLVHYCGINLQ